MLTMSLVGDSGFFGSLGAGFPNLAPALQKVKAQQYRALAAKATTAKARASYLAMAAAADRAATATKGPAVAARSGKGHFVTAAAPKGATKGPAIATRSGAGHFKPAPKFIAAVTAQKAALIAKVAAAKTPQAVTVDKATAKRLQAALATLGKIAGSAQLKAIKVDGALGKKTVAAVNLTFTKHLGAGQAPAQYRTGKLTLNQVKGNAGTFATLIENEIRRRGGVPVPASVVAKSQPKATGSAIKAANKALAAKKKAAAAAAKKNAALAKRNALRASAAAKRAQAANVRSYNPAAANVLDERAAADEAAANGATIEATTAATDESSAASEAEVAATQADEIATTATAQAMQMTPTPDWAPNAAPSMAPPALGPEGPVQASMIPSIESGSFIDRYKYPLLGGVALLGLLAVLTNKRPAAKKPLAPMNGTRRRRSRGRR